MNAATKSVLKIVAVPAGGVLAFCIAGFVHVSSFAPDDGVDHFSK